MCNSVTLVKKPSKINGFTRYTLLHLTFPSVTVG